MNWVTQAFFNTALVAVEVKIDALIHDIKKTAVCFALNLLGKGQQSTAYAFFKPAEREGQEIIGEAFHPGSTGSPVLDNTLAFVEERLLTTVEEADNSIFVGELVYVGLNQEPEGRADVSTVC